MTVEQKQMTPKTLRKLGEQAFGPRWRHELARRLPCNERTVRRWLAGHTSIGPMIAERIKQVTSEQLIEKS